MTLKILPKDTPMLSEAKKYVRRKLKKLNYLNANLPEGYEVAETEYRRVRDDCSLIAAVLKSLTNYEYGGRLMKTFSGISNRLSSTTSLKALQRDDIYTNASAVGELLAAGEGHSQLSETASNFSKAFSAVADAKRQMNSKIDNVLVSLAALRKDAGKIDDDRHRVADLRYSFEELVQGGDYSEGDRNKVQAEFNLAASETLAKMHDFVGSGGLCSLLSQAAAAYREFTLAAGNALKRVK